MTITETHVNSVAMIERRAASDRCDCDWCNRDLTARPKFWRCFFGGLALLIAAVFLFI